MDQKTTESTDTTKNGVKVPTKIPPIQPGAASGEQPNKAKVLQVIFVALLVGVIGFGGGWLGAQRAITNDESSTSAQRVVLDKRSNLISELAKEVGQSVVSVNVTTQSERPGYSGFFGYYGGGTTEQQSAGTGIILNKDGLIITNRHVVPAGTTKVGVVLADGTEFKDVEVIGRTNENSSLDVAFLRIKDVGSHKLVPAKLGKSSDMRVGDSVIAIGNALGQFQNTVTTGIVSGYGRSVQAGDGSGSNVESLDDLFQTDAAINPGNSGGPLVNLDGEVIGINTAVAEAENIGFAIPIDNVSGLIRSVSEKGKLEQPYIGVVYVPLTDALAKEFNLPVNRGAYIPKSEDYGQDTVIDGSPAEKAGLQEGDVITEVDGEAIDENTSLSSLLGRQVPGDKVELTINRDGKTQKITVTLGTAPGAAS